MKILFLFLDGVGLGSDDPLTNPFALARMPHLQSLLGGKKLLASEAAVGGDSLQHGLSGEYATLLALDACLGVGGLPQSATGQAVLLTGQNVPAALGYHYGPKPNPAVAEFLRNGNLFSILSKAGQPAAFLSAYPPRYFEAIHSGKRLYSAIPLAATSAGLSLRTIDDLIAGRAVSADFTAQGWRDHLGLAEIPVLTPQQAGARLAELGRQANFSLFEHWSTDYAGHSQQMQPAVELLENIDQVLGGLVEDWDAEGGLVLLTSDHGNLEDLSTRRHTYNPVPGLLVGASHLRRRFVSYMERSAASRSENAGVPAGVPAADTPFRWQGMDISDLAPAIIEFSSSD